MNIGFRKAFLNLFRCFRHEPGRRISVSGMDTGSADAHTFAATHLLTNESSSNNPNVEDARENIIFLETQKKNHDSNDSEENMSTNFLN